MNIYRDITCDNKFKGTFKLTIINGEYWWMYDEWPGLKNGTTRYYEATKPLGLLGRKILNEWTINELIEFREEDINGDS